MNTRPLTTGNKQQNANTAGDPVLDKWIQHCQMQAWATSTGFAANLQITKN